MAILKNARHERFAQNLAKGMSATEAYTKAGYKPHGQNAGRMMKNDEIVKRVAELTGDSVKQITDVRDLARQYTATAIATLGRIAADPKAPHNAQVQASAVLLDRGHGKAVQHIEAEISVYDALGLDDKTALLAALDGMAEDEDSTVH